jgi:hypothetical protein
MEYLFMFPIGSMGFRRRFFHRNPCQGGVTDREQATDRGADGTAVFRRRGPHGRLVHYGASVCFTADNALHVVSRRT